MKTFFIVRSRQRSILIIAVAQVLIFLLLLVACGGAETEPAAASPNATSSDSCDCELTSRVVSDTAADGSEAEVEVDTCMEPRPCIAERLDVTSYDDADLTSRMERELKDKGTVYALLDIKPDDKTWDPAIQITVILDPVAPRDNFSLTIFRWDKSATDWLKEGTAIADKKGDDEAVGEINHTSLFAFVDETEEAAEAPEEEEELVTVPDVMGLQLADARERLENEDLEVSHERVSDDEVEAGEVMRMRPRAGSEVDPGTTVHLVVSDGPEEPERFRVPDVVGMSVADAEKALQNVELFVSDIRDEESDEEEGTVIDTDPRPGTEVEIGEGILLDVAIPVEETAVFVPDLIGESVDDAASALPGYELRAGETIPVESSQPEGTVIDMQPGPGEEVPVDTFVDLYFAVPMPVEVPDVRGMYIEEAIDILAGSDLEIGNISEVEAEYPYTEAGIVRFTEPGEGALVERFTPVDIFIVTATVQVPDVTGDFIEVAIDTLLAAGLEIGEISEVLPLTAQFGPGSVHSTDPPANTIVDRGAPVNIAVEAESPDDYTSGYMTAEVVIEEFGISSAAILYDENSGFSSDRMQGFYDGFSENGGEITDTIPLNPDWQTYLTIRYQAGDEPEFLYFPVPEPAASDIAEFVQQLNEETGAETILHDANGVR